MIISLTPPLNHARYVNDISINVSNVFIDSSGSMVNTEISNSINKTSIKGVKFLIRKGETTKIKSMTYFDCDISNDGFIDNPEFQKYLNSIRPCNTFVKSASYLMNYHTFSDIRDLVLKQSHAILEDDTGIPYKYFNHSIWNINLYGVYAMPVKDFNTNRYQKDLDSAYKDSTLYKGKLPFSLGYHWGTDLQNQMLYTKK